MESQAKALGTLALAPLAGFAVDRLAADPAVPAFWVVGALGVVIAGLGSMAPTMRPAPAEVLDEATPKTASDSSES